MMIASNRAPRLPARTSFAEMVVKGILYWSKIQRVQPSSIDGDELAKIAIRRALLFDSPVATQGVAGTGASVVASTVTGSGSMATSKPKSSGSVCATTSYGRFGGPPGYSCRSG